jgi:hypothetical protein
VAVAGRATEARAAAGAAWVAAAMLAAAAVWAAGTDLRLAFGLGAALGPPWPLGVALYLGGRAVWRNWPVRALDIASQAFGAAYVPVLGAALGARFTWLVVVGGIEAWLGILVWRAARDAWRARTDRLRVSLGRRAGPLGDRVAMAGEDRFLHLHVLGATGSGKSSGVLLPLWVQDVRRPVGLTLLDPKGDLAAAAAARAERAGRRVTRLFPGGAATLNPLAGDPVTAAEAAVYALDRAFGGDHPFYRPLGQTLARFSVRALKEVVPDAGLAELARFWIDEEERLKVLVRVQTPEVRAYFRDVVASWPARARAEYLAGLQNAVLGLLGNPDLAALWRPAGAVNLADHLAGTDVLVVTLSLDRLGAAGGLAGAFVLAAYIRAALGRGQGGPAHLLYVDEVGTLAPGGLAEFLAVARGYRVGAVLAHQEMGQLAPDVRRAVWANARHHLVLGGVGPEDARTVSDLAGAGPSGRPRLSPTQVREVPRGQAWALLSPGGSAAPPLRLRLPHLRLGP